MYAAVLARPTISYSCTGTRQCVGMLHAQYAAHGAAAQGFDTQGFDTQGFDTQGFDTQGFDTCMEGGEASCCWTCV